MQSIAPLTHDDFKAKAKRPVSKLEIYVSPAWINICDLSGENYLVSVEYSKGQEEQSYKPIAAAFSAVIDNQDGLFHPQNNDSAYKDYFKVGRKIKFSTGFTKNSTDYLWQWFIGVISDIEVDNDSRQVMVQGFDYMQYLSEVQLKSPDNYWGTTVTKSGVKGQAEYSMPADCNGVYLAYFDSAPMYEGKHWVYDRTENEFVFLQGYVPTANGANNLVIYYFTDQVVENVVADILVSAGLYADQAAALAAMDYTATGVTLKRVWFSSGLRSLTAIQKLCERVDYRFHFSYDATPIFKPIAKALNFAKRKFTFTKNLIAEPDYFENIDEVKNVIRVEGEKYSEGDELFGVRSGGDMLDDSVQDRHVKEMVTVLPYETQALVSSTKDVIVPFYLPTTMLSINYVYLNLYFPGLEDGDYPKSSPNIYSPTINAACLQCWRSFPDVSAFSMDTSGKIKAGIGAIDATHNYLWRSYIKFNISTLSGFKLSSCDLKWALENIIRTGAGANSQLSMILDALGDFGDVDLDLWSEASEVAYGNVNVWNDLIGYTYSKDVSTRIQALMDAKANNACFRFKGSSEPDDGVNTINYILNNIWLYAELEEDTDGAVSVYRDNGAGFGGSIGSYSTNQENIDLTAQFSGSGKKQLKFTCSKTRRIDVLIRIGLTINRP